MTRAFLCLPLFLATWACASGPFVEFRTGSGAYRWEQGLRDASGARAGGGRACALLLRDDTAAPARYWLSLVARAVFVDMTTNGEGCPDGFTWVVSFTNGGWPVGREQATTAGGIRIGGELWQGILRVRLAAEPRIGRVLEGVFHGTLTNEAPERTVLVITGGRFLLPTVE